MQPSSERKTIHQSIPEAKTKQEAEQAERQIIKASFDHSYNVADTITTMASFIEKKYRPYVEQNSVKKCTKDLYGEYGERADQEKHQSIDRSKPVRLLGYEHNNRLRSNR